MSRLTTSPATPVLTGIMLALVTTLALPAAGQAQSATSPERALLNVSTVSHSAHATSGATAGGAIDGERALVAHFQAGSVPTTTLAVRLPSGRSAVDGERALLGRQRPR